MKNLINKKVLILILIIITLFGNFNSQISEAASGCPASRPAAITGTIYAYGGDYHMWTINVLVGIDLHNGDGKKVNVDGSLRNQGSYSYIDTVNPTLPQPGVPSGLDRTFGENNSDGNGVLCVSNKVKTAWFELYPKDTSGSTSKTYYGGANDQRRTVNANSTNSYNLRLPTAYSYGGNTGDINGFVSYNGHSVSSNNLKFRVFPVVPGSACGVQGFSAGASTVGDSPSQPATYYLVKNLAGGQCGEKKQTYKLTISCINNACGSSNKSTTLLVKVGKGARPRVDFKF